MILPAIPQFLQPDVPAPLGGHQTQFVVTEDNEGERQEACPPRHRRVRRGRPSRRHLGRLGSLGGPDVGPRWAGLLVRSVVERC